MLIAVAREIRAKIATALLRITLKTQLPIITKTKTQTTLQTQPLIILNHPTNQLIQILADQFALYGKNYKLDLGIGNWALVIGHRAMGNCLMGNGRFFPCPMPHAPFPIPYSPFPIPH
jgi:hypothetical protein